MSPTGRSVPSSLAFLVANTRSSMTLGSTFTRLQVNVHMMHTNSTRRSPTHLLTTSQNPVMRSTCPTIAVGLSGPGMGLAGVPRPVDT